MFLVLQIPAFHVPGFTDSGFSCSWFYRFRLFTFLVLQIPAFHVPCFLVPCSVPRSVPRFPVPCFTDSRMITHTFAKINILPGQVSSRWRQDQLILHGRRDGKVLQKVARLLKMVAVQATFLF